METTAEGSVLQPFPAAPAMSGTKDAMASSASEEKDNKDAENLALLQAIARRAEHARGAPSRESDRAQPPARARQSTASAW